MSDLKTTTELAAKVTQELSSVQIRSEVGKAIAVLNGMQEVLKIYGTEMDYESNKKLFDAMVQSANVAIRTSQSAVAKQALTRNKEDLKNLKRDAEAKVFGAKTENAIIGINGKQDFVSVEVEGDDSMKEFCNDLVKALNGSYKKSILVAGEKLEKIASE